MNPTEPDAMNFYLDFFIKGGGWAGLILFVVIGRYIWLWRNAEVKDMRDMHAVTVGTYIKVIAQKDAELKIAQENQMALYKEQSETLGESIEKMATVLTNTHNSNSAVAIVMAKVEAKL